MTQNSLSWLSRSHSEYTIGIYALVVARFVRYKRSQQREDLNKSIVHCTEAIFLPPISQDNPGLKNGFQLLFQLAFALLDRSEKFKRPEDVKPAIECLRYLRRIPLDQFDVSRSLVTTSLIRALAIQVESEAGNGTKNIEEMVDLCREFLPSSSKFSTISPDAPFLTLLDTVSIEFSRGRTDSLDQVIGCLRGAVEMRPPVSRLLLAVAQALCIRFFAAHSNDDYEEATALLEMFLDPAGECPNSLRDLATSLATALALTRSTIFEDPGYAEVTTSRLNYELRSSSVDERHRAEITNYLEMQGRERVKQYGITASLKEVNSSTSQVVDLSYRQSLEEFEDFPLSAAVLESFSIAMLVKKIQRLKELLAITPPGTGRHKDYLTSLVDLYISKSHRTDDISDLEESIKYSRLLLDATHSNDLWRVVPLSSLLNVLPLAFEKTGDICYLDESITIGHDILELTRAQHIHFNVVQALVPSLLARERLLGKREDRHEAVRLMSMAVDNQYTREPDRFRLACRWATLARSINHPTTSAAYKIALSLMQKCLLFAPTLSIQHVFLAAMREDYQTLPLDYASFQIHLGQFEEAVETLEQGRASFWSEMRGLRAPVAQLLEEDSPLTKRLTEINRELEALTTISITSSARPEPEEGAAQGGDGMDPFGRLVIKQRKLVGERNGIISQIQNQPGLEGFLKVPSFATLRSAASHGPVIIINHCKWRSDILIVFHKSLPCSIPTADCFYDRANQLRDNLSEARKHGLDSSKFQDVLSSVLKGLYELVGEPVIKRLRVLGVPEQSRIWWCPTSVFCFLPLHAMGPIPSNDTSQKRYFSDIYIPSYTPTLSALIESRREGPQMLDKPSLLLVAQPDDSLPGVKGEIKVIRALKARVRVKSLISSEATPSSVLESLRCSQFVHFACHGKLETGKPFQASFKLHGGSRLTLLEIVRSRLQVPDAEFAFLSCCHTAEITEESIADEALHLTATMQHCGFRSVVGTMWEMVDTDGRDLAKSLYNSLFSSREAGGPYYERSARALRDATRKLRRKGGIKLERWVNFVHYGA